MSIAKMSLVTINGPIKDIDNTMMKCCKAGIFHPERAMSLEEYTKSNNLFISYSKDTGYLRKIVNLAAKLGLGVSESDFPKLKEFEEMDKLVVDRESFSVCKDENEVNKAYDNPYKELLQIAEEISLRINIDIMKDDNYCDMSLEDMKSYLNEIKDKIVNLSEKRINEEKIISEYESVGNHIDNIIHTNINFDELFSCKYLKIRFGRLPNESYEKLKIYEDKENCIFFSLNVDASYRWCLYITSSANVKKVDEMFSSLFFERIRIPNYAHGTPSTVKEYIKNQIKEHESIVKDIDMALDLLSRNIKQKFCKVYFKVKFFSECFDNKKYAAVVDGEFFIIGFIPSKDEKKFIDGFRDLSAVDITIKNPTSDDRLEVPVKLKNNKFSEPFEDFVAMYGLPAYKDVDPTIFMSIIYTLLFGIMFGDIGQGLTIVLIGHIIWRIKKLNFGRILTRIGFSSAFFGVIYGSCFGYEDIFEKYIEKIPQPYYDFVNKISHKDTNTLLLGAVGIGAVLIVCSMIFNIIVGIKHKNISSYLFGNNGLAGLIFYSSVIIAAAGMSFFNLDVLNIWFILFFILLPLILIFLKEPLGDKIIGKKMKFNDGVGGFIIENFFEMFDVLLSFVTNTISFIRVGAFVLSHAGMMMVVMQFVRSFNMPGSIIVLIFGNLFVMCFEGLIVGIQVLRLQFYEMFSRCFDGSGKPFKNI